ncbi:uncharacterized protein PAC_05290 [Phialocephala subalpina]|uniref:Non-homologous end-joining factor 1 n=1 Tax=Phialocephala subalpina TaxID=576137 RepID=A0A1L7WRJ7_9HELO|nr:uncharacterized protein PAC_05290 [Phialocephala subalpina]
MAWRPLRLSTSASAHLPPLLISADLATDGFTIHLSDLTSIWSETLNHDDIIRRSREETTTIDPSDKDQFQIFCEKLKLGLNGGKGTTLALTIQPDADRPCLVLNVTVDLPGGLAQLEWPVRLSAAPQTQLTSQLITPLLRAQHERMQEVASLGEMLKEKDHVMQKLLDKLESQGTELGQVFPQVGTKVGRKVDRKKAAERVKGLAPFDVGDWRKGLGHNELQDTKQLIEEVFRKADDLPLQPGEPSSEEDTDPWWENIKGITVNLNTGKISTKPPSKGSKKTPPPPKPKPKPALKKQESSDDDDDFQVQATPPRSSAAKRALPPKAALDDTTDDEDDDLDGPSQRSKIPDSFPKSPSPPPKAPSPKPAKKILGKIGGGNKAAPKPSLLPVQDADATTDDEDNDEPIPQSKPTKMSPPKASAPGDEALETESESESTLPKPAPKARSPTPEPASRPVKKVGKRGKIGGKIGGKKESPPPPPADEAADEETDEEPEVVPEAEPTSPPKAATPPAASTKPKKKLGTIGGKKKAAESTPAPEERATTSPAPKAGVKRKLGQIGGNKSSPLKSSAAKQESSSQTADDDSMHRGRAPEKENTPPPRETSEERATKKREQLARELAAKASKAPVKKKRKF